jgi:hypothetical protein
MGKIAYTPVNSSLGFWAFNAPGYSVAGARGGSQNYNIHGIADTGATLLLLPQAVVDDYYSHVGGAQYDSDHGGVTFRCSATIPDLVIYINNDTGVRVPGDYIRYGPVDSLGESDELCYGGIQSNIGIGFSIFGDVFLKAAFVVFDAGELQLGFADKTL